MRHLRLQLALFLILGTSLAANAQWRYVADNIYGDSVRVFERMSNPDSKDSQRAFKAGQTAFRIANGDTLLVEKADSNFIYSNYTIHEEAGYKESWVPGAGNSKFKSFVTVTIHGKKYLVRKSDLVLAENGGESDWVNAKGVHHTPMAHWFGTYTPYLLTLLFLVLALVFAFGATAFRPLAILSPLMLLGAIAIEGLALYYMGSEALWILDMKELGIGTAVWHGLLMLIALLLQWFSLAIVAGGDEDGLSYKAPLFCTLAGFGVLVVMVMIDGLFIHDGHWSLTIGLIIMAALMLTGIGISLSRNIQAIGIVGGIVFTLFVIIWTVGVVVMAILLLMGLLEYFGDMILFFIAFGIALGMMGWIIPITTFVKDGVLYKVYER